MNVRVERLTTADADLVFDWILRLLRELGEEGDQLGDLDRASVLNQWRARQENYHVLVARDETDNILGILTLSVAFAVYANGEYGVIDEMYVDPRYRSTGIGALLVKEAQKIGKARQWKRIDVTAPESDRWERTRRFYEKLGFTFTGPKLKLPL